MLREEILPSTACSTTLTLKIFKIGQKEGFQIYKMAFLELPCLRTKPSEMIP